MMYHLYLLIEIQIFSLVQWTFPFYKQASTSYKHPKSKKPKSTSKFPKSQIPKSQKSKNPKDVHDNIDCKINQNNSDYIEPDNIQDISENVDIF